VRTVPAGVLEFVGEGGLFARLEESLNRPTSAAPSGSTMRSSNPPVGNGSVLSNPRRLGMGSRRFGESHRAGVALDREQELMKLESHPPFGRPIMEVAQGTLKAAKRPVQR